MGLFSRNKDKVLDDDASSTKKAKKGKKVQHDDVKPDFDLSSALPSTNDFRTSLILPGLSTRFSMLREQDDPTSKIGKASDDSVLAPKRSSRLHEFGFAPGGLSDIAEVASLSSSIRPPFANDRTSSFDSDRTGDESASMMSRARPGEGNVLFGGRQKIYMISNNSSAKGLGRTLYDDDVNMSAYQRLRAEEKERLRREADAFQDQHSQPSSPTTRSQKRETSSSTTSAPDNTTRTSTAATSIASQGASEAPITSPVSPPSAGPFPPADPNRSTSTTTKTRRLYDQGLDQHIQDQQSSAINRLNSLQKARAPTAGRSTPPIPLSQTRSATNLSDRFNRGPMFRSDSPNAMPHPGVARKNSQLSSGCSSPVVQSQTPPPASPVISEVDEMPHLNAALQQGDRGKATALGAFNKPKEAFSEQQYTERLRQMQPDREAPKELPGFPAPVMEVVPKMDRSPPQKPTLRERAEQERRRRAESIGRQRSESSASSTTTEPSPAIAGVSVFQAAANRMKAAANALQSPPLPTSSQLVQQQSPNHQPDVTFLTSRDSSDAEEPAPTRPSTARTTDTARRFENLPVATGPAPSIFEHPAMRSRTVSEEQVPQVVSQAPSPMPPQGLSPRPDLTAEREVDSPTLGPNSGGLSGLIRQHLRSDSNVSSNYGESDYHPSAPVGLAIQTHGIGLQPRQPGSDSTTPAASNHSHSNPWDLDDFDRPSRNERGSSSPGSPVDGQRMPSNAASLGQQWDSRRNHERIASNETEGEHEAFQRDLAQRQRVIQENLRARAEGRSTSPAPGGPSGGLKNALNMLRAKSSRESFAVVERGQTEVPNKGLRKLAGGGAGNASTTSLVGSFIGEHWKAEMPSLKPKTSRLGLQNDQDSPREFQGRQRSGTDSSRVGRPVGREPPVMSRSSTRDRSGSGTSSGRSLSRATQYRNELDSAYPLPTERPSMDSQGGARSRSNSCFESKHLHPIQTNTSHPPLPVPSGVPQPKHSPALPISPRPSPGGYSSPGMSPFHPQSSPMPPFSATPTPPASNPTTPNAAAFNASAQPLIRQGMLRKRSIAKSDISEPVFVSTTSVIDTVSLPAGASLKNGIDSHSPPPVPPINPMRRRFGFGRSDSDKSSDGPTSHPDLDAPRAPFSEAARTQSSEALSQIPQPRNRLRKSSSESKSLHGRAQGQPDAMPAMPPVGFHSRHNAAPRPINGQPIAQRNMNGAMF